MKKIILGTLLAVGLASGIAYAHGNWSEQMRGFGGGPHGMRGGGGMMGGYGYGCPGAAADGMGGAGLDFFEKTADLRRKLHDLRFDYMEAYRNPETTQKTLADLRREMDSLHDQMLDIAQERPAQ